MPNHPQPSCPRATALLRVVLLVFGGQVVIFYALHNLFRSEDSALAVFFDGGFDYTYFYQGAQAWLAGRDPYGVFGFVTPPLSLLIPSLLSHLSFDRATLVFVCCNLILVPMSLWWYAHALRLPLRERVLLLGVVTLFISAQECMRGGNMDGVMFALLVAAFSVRHRLRGAMRAGGQRGHQALFDHPASRGAAAAAVALRRAHRGRDLDVTSSVLPSMAIGAACDGGAPRPRYPRFSDCTCHPDLFGAGRTRQGRQGPLSGVLGDHLCRGTLSRPGRDLTPRTLARYIPWMFALPAQVFSYEAVLALVVLASLVATACERWLRRARILQLHWVPAAGNTCRTSDPPAALVLCTISIVLEIPRGVTVSGSRFDHAGCVPVAAHGSLSGRTEER